jgi:heparin binding hemagglutinin HbhA
MTGPTNTRIPAPLYAAAGAGDLAYRQLRKLPAIVTDLRGKARTTGVELREKAVAGTDELRERAAATLRNASTSAGQLRGKATPTDLHVARLRVAARRNAAAVVAGAHVAQERATTVYSNLVARGERVIGTGVVQAADTVNADMEATEAPAEVTATAADVAVERDDAAETPETKVVKTEPAGAAKHTRPAAQ